MIKIRIIKETRRDDKLLFEKCTYDGKGIIIQINKSSKGSCEDCAETNDFLDNSPFKVYKFVFNSDNGTLTGKEDNAYVHAALAAVKLHAKYDGAASGNSRVVVFRDFNEALAGEVAAAVTFPRGLSDDKEKRRFRDTVIWGSDTTPSLRQFEMQFKPEFNPCARGRRKFRRHWQNVA